MPSPPQLTPEIPPISLPCPTRGGEKAVQTSAQLEHFDMLSATRFVYLTKPLKSLSFLSDQEGLGNILRSVAFSLGLRQYQIVRYSYIIGACTCFCLLSITMLTVLLTLQALYNSSTQSIMLESVVIFIKGGPEAL